jgi:hypothetical protein
VTNGIVSGDGDDGGDGHGNWKLGNWEIGKLVLEFPIS